MEISGQCYMFFCLFLWCPWLSCDLLVLVWKISSLCASYICSRQSCPWPLKLMMSQAVERKWIHTGSYRQLRGEWVKRVGHIKIIITDFDVKFFSLLWYFTMIQSTLYDNIMYSFFFNLFLVVINKITPKLHKIQAIYIISVEFGLK